MKIHCAGYHIFLLGLCLLGIVQAVSTTSNDKNVKQADLTLEDYSTFLQRYYQELLQRAWQYLNAVRQIPF
ncbi:hypothetical protein BDF20DRAFT_873676 [Mycotypha africana]|uniref:uncharacterized protein n=1 Tax=Mycotypha africana TaxID=64632 RepID=UPI0023015D27|nr:uncharacterized protein BDF20DRAFT_873676 [Mycotypha africana]KAI8977233.1 hypothetical protein BDF20DRAFT_873676 [Mycotypha africana]